MNAAIETAKEKHGSDLVDEWIARQYVWDYDLEDQPGKVMEALAELES